MKSLLLLPFLLISIQLPFEEFIVPTEEGFELSTGDHDWFISHIFYDQDLYANGSTYIMLFIDPNGTDTYINGSYALRATIHFKYFPMWFDIGYIPYPHQMTPVFQDCFDTDEPPCCDLSYRWDCFYYLYNWSYPDMDHAFETYDAWGRPHYVSELFFFINVSLAESWATTGWYPPHVFLNHAVEEWEVTKPPDWATEPLPCGGVQYDYLYPWQEVLRELIMVGSILFAIYLLIRVRGFLRRKQE